MNDILVASVSEKHAYPSDFGAKVSGTTLLVPENVASALKRLSVRSAEEFVSYLRTFPSALAQELGWDVSEVVKAREALVNELRGIVSDELLDSPPPRRRGYGALNPASFRSKAR